MQLPRLQSGDRITAAGRAAFTLLEVVLAISIAIAILVVALTFHQQAAMLRSALLGESERLATVRQVMDRLAFDLRVAVAHEQVGFTGDSNSLRFVASAMPLPLGGVQSGLKRIAYRTTFGGEGDTLTITGLTRTEEPAVNLITSSRTPALATTDSETEAPAAEDGPAPSDPAAPVLVANEPLTETLRYLSFRFWDGTSWSESWSDTAPPPGVEVTLGFEPLAPDEVTEEPPGEVFRRVIYLPSGEPRPPETELVASAKAR